MRILVTFSILAASLAVYGLEIGGKTVPGSHAERVASALERAEDNGKELRQAFAKVPTEQLEGLSFLVAHMPDRDLESLKAAYILTNLKWAYKARSEVSWGGEISDALFFNDVLPYASINERRDNWREDFYRRFMPLVKDCKTPGEAAQVLNKEMWDIVDVRYHARKRPKPDQSPYESMEAKYASCTGLSVLLIDACRAVSVPARFVGTPLWANKRGNHSWVEVWDGDWKFTGACEYDKKGLNRGWFKGSAAKAIKGDRRHAIYASSWKNESNSFPLVWNRKIDYVNAIDVTERYAETINDKVYVDVFTESDGQRVAQTVEVWLDDKKIAEGRSRDTTNDTNDRLGFALNAGREHELRVVDGGKVVTTKNIVPKGEGDVIVDLFLK